MPDTTPIQDTVYDAEAVLFAGTLVVSWPAFIAQDGTAVAGGSKLFNISSGALNISLIPTVGADVANLSYTADFYASGSSTPKRETWSVPQPVGSPPAAVDLSAVRVLYTLATGITINPNQVTGTAVVASSASAQTIAGTTDPILKLLQQTAGQNVLELETQATGDDPILEILQNRATTTDATPTTLQSITLVADTVYLIEARVAARRTGGSAGNDGDGAAFIVRGAFKLSGSPLTAAIIEAIAADFEAADQASSPGGWAATLVTSGTAVQVQVTGATNNNVTWHVTVLMQKLSI